MCIAIFGISANTKHLHTTLTHLKRAVDLTILHQIPPANPIITVVLAGLHILCQVQLDIAQRYSLSSCAC